MFLGHWVPPVGHGGTIRGCKNPGLGQTYTRETAQADVPAAAVNNDTLYPGFGPGGGDVQIKPGAVAIFAGCDDRLDLDCGKLGILRSLVFPHFFPH